MKKYIRIKMALCLLLTLFVVVTKAQEAVKITVKAIVRGPNGEPLKGATVAGDAINTTTDERGAFSVEIPSESILTISADGYRPSLVVATSELNRVDLVQDVRMVPVAYKSVAESDLPAGVSNVNVTRLFEKNFFTYGLDGMEALAPGVSGNNVWGMGASLILVDGVPRDITSVMPNEIDQITFLKSASAIALYGSRGARGVIMVTTKRGTESDQKITVRSNAGLNVPKAYPQYLGSSEYMTLYNEARLNDGLGRLYSDVDIYNYSGVNPYRYPSVDYYSSDYIKNSFGRYDAVTEIYGGNERAKYYTNLGFNSTGSLLNFGEAKDNNTTQRFNVRGNVDMKLTNILKARVDASAVFSNGGGVNTDYWASAATLRPHRFTPLIPLSYLEESDQAGWAVANAANIIDGKYVLGGTSLDPTNPIAAIYAGGNNKFVQREFQFTTGVDADLKGILKGLSFNTTLGVDYWNRYNQGYRNGYATYQPNWTSYSGNDMLASLQIFGQDTKSGNEVIADSWYRQTISLSSQLNYNTVFNKRHNVSAVLMGAAYRQAISETYQPTTNSNLGLQLGYNLDRKYYAELTGAVVRSPKLAPGNRVAFSPAVSLGWRLSEESFLKDVSFLNNLKLTASAGILNTDLDINDYFLYESIYTATGGNWYGWNDGSGTQSTDSRRGTNLDLEMARREELTIGLEGAMFKNRIAFETNFFRSNMSNIPEQLNVLYPSYFAQNFPASSFVPFVNYSQDQRNGVDFRLNFRKPIGSVNWDFGIAGLYVTSKATKRPDLYTFDDKYQYRAGKPLDAIWGLESDGFYMDAGEVAAADGINAPKPAYGAFGPGDIKYKDQNGDNIINDRDQVYLGRWGSPTTLGFNLSANWKNFTVFALATGRFGGSAVKSNNYFWVNGDDKYSAVVRNRWTEETKTTATFPRLTTLGGDNNFRTSDFWMYSTDRLDLSKVQLSYKISDKILKSKYIRDLGVYVAGFNLLTVAKEREILEMNLGSAPQTRMYNLGVKALF